MGRLSEKRCVESLSSAQFANAEHKMINEFRADHETLLPLQVGQYYLETDPLPANHDSA